jgi:hypothetical protein
VTHNKSPEELPSSENDSADSSAERPKKERVIHTRVPAVLEAELKRFADNLRVPVSNLVRTILEDAVAVADRASDKVEQRLISAAHQIHGEREKVRRTFERDPLDGVYAFQALVINNSNECAKCKVDLAAGDEVHLALTDKPGPRAFVCSQCLPGKSNPK